MNSLRPCLWPEISSHVLVKTMSCEDLCARLSSALAGLYPPAVRKDSDSKRSKFYDTQKSIEQFKTYWKSLHQKTVVLNEINLYGLETFLINEGLAPEDARRHVLNLRKLVHQLPSSERTRQLLGPKGYQRALRFHRLEPKTQEMLKWFLAEGRRSKNGKLTQQLLTEGVRNDVLDLVVKFLERLGKTSLAQVTEKDAEDYVNKHVARGGRRDTACNTLSDIRRLFQNLFLRGSLKHNPCNAYVNKITRPRDDYISREGVQKLMDLSIVDATDFTEVRDALITTGLLYDFALRKSEVAHLRLSHVKLGDPVEISLPGECQKGGNKETAHLWSYFDTTKRLFELYLGLRSKIPCATDALLVNGHGRRLMDGGCEDAVHRFCKKRGVLTKDGKCPSPHVLRHTFGTLNAESIGLRLPIGELSERLRHTSLDFTYKHYVSKNRELRAMRHEATRRRASIQSQLGVAGHPEEKASGLADFVTDREALRLLSPLGVTLKGLREFACHRKELIELNGETHFRRDVILDLVKNWKPKSVAMALMDLPNATFFDFTRRHAIKPVKIGRASLYRISDLADAFPLRTPAA